MNELDVGRNIRRIRMETGLSLTALAGKTDLAKSSLSKIETGQVSAPISTLIRIAEALNVPVVDFFEESDENPAFVYTPKGQGTIVTRNGTKVGYNYEALALGMHRKTVEPFVVTIYTNNPGPPSHHGGHEFVYMISGRMEFTVGDDRVTLNPGDSLFFDPTKNHISRALSEPPVQFLCLFIQHPFADKQRMKSAPQRVSLPAGENGR